MAILKNTNTRDIVVVGVAVVMTTRDGVVITMMRGGAPDGEGMAVRPLVESPSVPIGAEVIVTRLNVITNPQGTCITNN